MERCDALIVGGGPAGSSCARALRRAGLDVAVIDRKPFPRDKVCAGWITPAVIEELEIDVASYASSRTFQPFTGFRTSVMGGPEVATTYEHPISYGIRRCELDWFLLERSGARLLLGRPLGRLRRAGDLWIADERIEAPVVVGAGGHFCPVARLLGAELGRGEPSVVAQEVEFPLDEEQRQECSVTGELPELLFSEDMKGYGWVVRKGAHLNVGLGRVDPRDFAGHLRRFLELLRARGKVPRGTPERFSGHAYLLWGVARRELLGDGVLLAGDAAGLAYPQSGEGIRPAIESGLLAARAIVAAAGDYRRERLEPYAASLVERFGPRQGRPALSELLPSWLVRPLSARLLASGWFSRRVLVERWFLHAHEPPLRPPRDRPAGVPGSRAVRSRE